ncbi:MAG TPA: type II toxin-antitoxin system VapC family toxin [Myxococcota bacterium]|nr:type II toxin-antitoxin system VapC family toxin [Myxococcota bacterium]
MTYLLDTNVLSETWKPSPDKNVIDWLKAIPAEKLYISVLTIGEIRRGVELLPASRKRKRLLSWLEEELPNQFSGNMVSIDLAVAERWGFLTATSKKTLPAIDGLLAATALTHNMKLVTRNEKDFNITGLEVINPF